MLRIVFLLIMSFLLVSCMKSYTVPRATIHLQTQDPSEIELVKNSVDKFLLERGFVNKGIDEHMLELFTRNSGNHNENQFQINHIEKLKKTIHYENKDLDMRVQTLDFSSLEFKKKHVQYEHSKVTIEDKPAVELNIYNSRQGGFSIKALDLYNDLINSKSITDISEVVVIYSPPPTNKREFYTFKVFNVLSFIVLWSISFAISVAIFTAIIRWLMYKTYITNKTKKLVFVAGGFAFCTPFPFPLSIFGMFFLPSIFAITEFGSDYFWKLQAFTIPSCIFSFLICAVIAKKIFKDSEVNKNDIQLSS